jgi:hypothetical protein
MSDFEEQTWVLEAGVGKRIRLYVSVASVK